MLEPTKEPLALGGRSTGLDPRGLRTPEDFGDIGEDSDGIWLKRHPQAIVLEHPEVWAGLERFELGHGELGPKDADRLNAVDFQVLALCIDTSGRERRRREQAIIDQARKDGRRGR